MAANIRSRTLPLDPSQFQQHDVLGDVQGSGDLFFRQENRHPSLSELSQSFQHFMGGHGSQAEHLPELDGVQDVAGVLAVGGGQQPGVGQLAGVLHLGGQCRGAGLRTWLRRSRTAQTLADGTALAGPAGPRTVRLNGSVAGSRKVVVCFLGAGTAPAVILPPPGTPTRVTVERSDGLADYADVGLELSRSDDRSLLALLPEVFDRTSLFRPGWVGAWTYWFLLVALVIGVPVLLSGALASASEEDESDSSRAST